MPVLIKQILWQHPKNTNAVTGNMKHKMTRNMPYWLLFNTDDLVSRTAAMLIRLHLLKFWRSCMRLLRVWEEGSFAMEVTVSPVALGSEVTYIENGGELYSLYTAMPFSWTSLTLTFQAAMSCGHIPIVHFQKYSSFLPSSSYLGDSESDTPKWIVNQ